MAKLLDANNLNTLQPVETTPKPESAHDFITGGYRQVRIPNGPMRRSFKGSRITVYVKPDTAKAMKRLCIDQHRSMSDLVQEAVAAYLDSAE